MGIFRRHFLCLFLQTPSFTLENQLIVPLTQFAHAVDDLITGVIVQPFCHSQITKNDVDLENNTISVNHNLIYRVIDGKAGFHITTPKTASGTRTIPILYPQVAEQLRTLIEVMDTLYPEDLVMNGYHGFLFRNREGYFLSAHNIYRAIQRISLAYNAEVMDQAEL